MKILGLMTMDMFRLTAGWALEELGHQLYYLDEAQEEVFEQAMLQFQPEILFNMGWDVLHSQVEQIAAVLGRHSLFHLYFAEEDPLHTENWSIPYCMQTRPHLVLTRNPQSIPFYEEKGFPVVAMDVGCNPWLHRPHQVDPAYHCEVAVVANTQLGFDIFRRESIQTLVLPLYEAGYDLRIYGRNWEMTESVFGVQTPAHFLRGMIPYHQTSHLFNGAKINLSIQSIPEQMSSRTFDILAAGGFLITSDTPGVRERLQPGVHCEVVATPAELLEKVAYYLSHEEERKAIAANGRQWALEHGSYQLRLSQVWSQVEAHYHQFQQRQGSAS